MSDITTCNGGSCLLRLNCHRYTCPKEEIGQSYFMEPPYKLNFMFDEHIRSLGVATLSCTFFWNNKDYENERPKSTNN